MQGYDSVAIQADVELGGTDQTFNLLVGRDVQRAHDQEPQVAFTMPILPGTDGDRKMSKSFGNHIGLTDPPEEQFGKTMRIPDSLLAAWYRLVWEREPPPGEPMELKLELARFLVTRSHGREAAARAEAHFTRVVREGRAPDEVPEAHVRADGETVYLPRLLVEHLGVASTSEARRLIAQGGVKLDGETVTDVEVDAGRLDGVLVQAGKRRFARILLSPPTA
jgi:tyrosyl-tRNA synthetase